MAYDDKGTKREVESLAKRFPKRGIDSTIPESIRAELVDRQRQEGLDKGIKAHEERKLAKGGNVKKMKKFADGGMIHSRHLDSVTGKPYDPYYLNPQQDSSGNIALRNPDIMDTMPDPRLMRGSNVPSRIQSEYAKGGQTKSYAKGGSVRGDGICQRGHTKGKMR